VHVFDAMDDMGYSDNMIKQRRAMYEKIDDGFNINDHQFIQITAGSKADGLAKPYESDRDIMFESKCVECVLSGDDDLAKVNSTLFGVVEEGCHPGHYKLKLLRKGGVYDEHIEQALLHDDTTGNDFLSSCLFTTGIRSKESYLENSDSVFRKKVKTGPSLPRSKGLYEEDRVYAFRCLSQKKILASWHSMDRHHWPTKELRDEVIKYPAHLVPVGCKGSPTFDMEWRICFTRGEKLLTASLNNCQQKLFILLKKVNSTHLKPISESMSSFIMKHVLYCIVGKNEQKLFTPNTLLHFLIKSLLQLKEAFRCGFLPYFMIPERNVLLNKFTESETNFLLKKLDKLIEEGPKCVLSLTIISQSLQQCVIERKRMGQLRDKMEVIKLEKMRIRARVYEQGISEVDNIKRAWEQEGYDKLHKELFDLLNPDWKNAFIEEVLTENIDMNIYSPKEREHILTVGKIFFEAEWPHHLKYLNIKRHDYTLDSLKDESILKVCGLWCLRLLQKLQ